MNHNEMSGGRNHGRPLTAKSRVQVPMGSQSRRPRKTARRCGSVAERFESYVAHVDGPGCWLWTGHRTAKGYGHLNVAGRGKRAHRLALELALGRPLVAGEVAIHGCDVPACVRVGDGHIRLGTQRENVHDAIAKGRRRRGPPPRSERAEPPAYTLWPDSLRLWCQGMRQWLERA